MARYLYETFNGKQIPLDDYMLTDAGLEGLQVTDEGKVILILILPDGSILFDFESGKSADALKEAKQEYQDITKKQEAEFREKVNEAISQVGYEINEDGEIVEAIGPTIEVPPRGRYPPGYV